MITQLNNTIHFKMKALRRYGAALAVLSLLTAPVFAQRTITLDEAIRLGVDNSNRLKLAKAQIDQAVSQYEQAKDRALPSGKVNFGYSRAEIPANTLAFGPTNFSLPKNANANLGTATLSEAIYAGGKYRYARESTDLLVQVAKLDADKDRDQIAYDIINEYFQLYKVLQSQKVVAANITAVDQQIHQSQRFFEQGLVTKNDVLRFQLQKANIELNGIDLESNRKIVNYNLDVLLGLPDTTQLNVTDVNIPSDNPRPFQNYLDTALTNRQELRELDLRRKVADVNIKDVHADRMPVLAASAAAYYVDVAANPFPTKNNYITPLTLGLNFSWNFGTLWTNKNRESEAKIQRDQVVLNKAISINDVRDEVNQNYQNFVAAINKINLLQVSIAQATENNKLQESRYQNATGNVTDRVDAQSQLYQAQINLELAKADAGLAYYTLLKSTGTLSKK